MPQTLAHLAGTSSPASPHAAHSLESRVIREGAPGLFVGGLSVHLRVDLVADVPVRLGDVVGDSGALGLVEEVVPCGVGPDSGYVYDDAFRLPSAPETLIRLNGGLFTKLFSCKMQHRKCNILFSVVIVAFPYFRWTLSATCVLRICFFASLCSDGMSSPSSRERARKLLQSLCKRCVFNVSAYDNTF